MSINKKRSVLSALGIIWGVFIMTLLIGVSNGFEHGVSQLFNAFSKGSAYVYGGEISVAYNGRTLGSRVSFNERQLEEIQKSIADIQYISPEASSWQNVKSQRGNGTFEVKGVGGDIKYIKQIETAEGRFLNKFDAMQSKKTAVLGERVAEVLFKNSNPIGNSVEISGESFKVVGVLKNSLANMYDGRCIYVPYSTYSILHGNKVQFGTFSYVERDGADSKKVVEMLKHKLSKMCSFDITDDKAVYINSMKEQSEAFSHFFSSLRAFIIFFGVSTLFGGILGIGNVMYASVQERTREIGIRKAIGAKTNSIMKMVVGEAVVLTSVSGLSGVVCGVVVLALISCFVPEDSLTFKNPSLNLSALIASIVILALSGILTGLKPAKYAATIHPIEALKVEN